MKGIQYVTDEQGERIAVQIDLRRYAKFWEDFQDAMLVKKRLKEPRTSLTHCLGLLKLSNRHEWVFDS